MLKNSEENMRILLLNNTPFFEFSVPENLQQKQFFFFESLRFVEVFNKNQKTNIFYENLQKPLSTKKYKKTKNDELFDIHAKMIVGKFLTNKTLLNLKFVFFLNFQHEITLILSENERNMLEIAKTCVIDNF